MPEEKLKLLHCADLHLDSAFAESDPDKASIRRNELRGDFSALVTYARVNAVRLILIAGDLFDGPLVTRDTVNHIMREFSSYPDCRFIISPGNHDPYTPDSVYAKADFPDNVFIFDSSDLSYFPFDDIGVDIYGYAFTSGAMESNPFKGLGVSNREHINILCAHCDLDNSLSKYCPVAAEDIAAAGFDYAALGHIHNSSGIQRLNDSYYGYSGCLEGRDFGECGYKGAILTEIEKNEHGLTVTTKGLRFSKRRYEKLEINLSGITDDGDAYDKIAAAIKGYGDDTSLHIILTGDMPASVTLSKAYICDTLSSKLFSVKMSDKTTPMYDYAALENDLSIRGALFRELLPMLKSDNAEERETAALALRYGLAAISGNDLPT